MGRKIPARRHHGVRDPLVQAAQREALIKDKINHPPEKKDFQKVSNKLAEFIKIKDEAKKGRVYKVRDGEDKPENYKSNQKPTTGSAVGSHRHDKNLQPIRRMQNEPDVDYLRRVNRITQESIKESQFESKYGVEVIRSAKGEITIKKRPVDELDETMKAARRQAKLEQSNPEAAKRNAKRNKNDEKNKKMTDAERRILVKEMMVAKKKEIAAKTTSKVVEYQQDVVAFGEVTHAPPTLVTPRRAQKAETVARPGAKKSLLLHSVLEPAHSDSGTSGDEEPVAKKSKKKSPAPKTAVDLKGKRKDLPVAARQMIERQQQNVMDMYRALKKKNRVNNMDM